MSYPLRYGPLFGESLFFCSFCFCKVHFLLDVGVLDVHSIAIISISIAILFIVVYDTAIDTVFVCYLIDEKWHGGKAVFATGDLSQMMNDYDKHGRQMKVSGHDKYDEDGVLYVKAANNQANIQGVEI